MAQPEQMCLIMGNFTQSLKKKKKQSEAKWNKITLSLNAISGGGVRTGVD